MRRREFVATLGAAAAWPLAAGAQQPAMPVVGWLNSRAADQDPHIMAAFRRGLGEMSFVEGRNVAIEYRWADGQYDRLPAMAADLVRRQVTVIAAGTTAAVLAAKAATRTVPIVFSVGANPIEMGLVASLARPGGNLTGVTTLGREVAPKRLELLHELVPTATTVAVLINPTNPTIEILLQDLQAAARTLGLQLHVLRASTERDFDAAFGTLAELRTGGLVIGSDAFFNTRAEQLAALALRRAVPTIYQFREFAAAGGLMSYGGSITDNYRLAGAYTGRILKGEKPADLPVQQATRVELIINMKTAKALGITFPITLLGRADEVIE
jgi:putative ABC transport system substrate-binding protein